MIKIGYIIIIFLLISLVVEIFILSDNKKTNITNELSIKENNIIIKNDFVAPINNPVARITKKPFGIYVSPKNSPVLPEKFTGYHTGVDFEIFPEEQNSDVSVMAICDGKILEKRQASGYGGMVVQSCSFNDNPVTIIYGHLKLSSIKVSQGENLLSDKFLGFLGNEYSTETDGERKHLHIGIHKGENIDTRGYVKIKSELNDWINIADYLK